MTATALIVGCGYLGRRVGRSLRARGIRVLGTTRSEEKGEALRGVGIEPAVVDLLKPEGLDRLPRVDAVLFCVGHDRAAGVPIRRLYVEGLRDFLAGFPGCSTFVYASSTGVYSGERGEWVDESTSPAPRTESGEACLEAEGVVRAFAEGRGVASVVLRLAGLYGPGRVIGRERLIRGEAIPGHPEKFINLVHVHDAAEAAASALLRPPRPAETEVFNVVDDRPVSREELYGLTARLLGAPPPTFEVSESGGWGESDKRVANAKMKAGLRGTLTYPDVTSGLPAAVSGEEP
jgi:nucleoside-diphosphate-sugar epimerase